MRLVAVIEDLRRENGGFGMKHTEIVNLLEREKAEVVRLRQELSEKTAYC